MLAFTPLFLSLVASTLAAPQMAKRAKTTIVKVGADNELKFDPPAIFADLGDQVIFQFNSKNHSVIESSFAAPCGPLAGGFRTAFTPVAAGLTGDALPTVSYTVSSLEPLWFYCSQAIHTPNAHCAKGMVFAINCPPSGEKSFDNFVARAKNSTDAVTPLPTDAIVPQLPDPTYVGITLPPQETAVTKTAVVSVETSTWTTVYASYPNSPAPTPASLEGNTINVVVGGGGQLTFDPPHITAQPRDKIVFEFQSKNHSVVQSAFGSPCTPLITAEGGIGINSGFFPFVDGQAAPTFTFTVHDTTPLYFFCGQTGHCGKGMVFTVNTNEQGARNYAAFQNLAKTLNGTDSGAPGGTTPGAAPPTPGNGASSMRAGLGLVFAGALAALLL